MRPDSELTLRSPVTVAAVRDHWRRLRLEEAWGPSEDGRDGIFAAETTGDGDGGGNVNGKNMSRVLRQRVGAGRWPRGGLHATRTAATGWWWADGAATTAA